jgi:hypothetical protein
MPPNTGQSFELVGYRASLPLGRTEAANFCFVSPIDFTVQTSVVTQITFSDSEAFEEALEWVFGEYRDLMRNLAA